MSRDRIVRQTSVEVYKELIESGALSGMRGEVWAWLYRNGPATRNEVAQGIHKVPNDTSTRLKELVDMGNAAEVGEDRCRVTGNNVILYDVTRQKWVGERPKKPRKAKPIMVLSESCIDCCLVTADDDGDESCGVPGTKVVGALPDVGRHEDCPLFTRDVVIRPTERKR